jgi:hypothetical protein
VADWLDSHGDDLTDYRDVGRGVKADMVVGIDLLTFNLHEGQTLLKGRAKVGVKVYDMTKGGELVYKLRQECRPENGGNVTEKRQLRTIFVACWPKKAQFLPRGDGQKLWDRRAVLGKLAIASAVLAPSAVQASFLLRPWSGIAIIGRHRLFLSMIGVVFPFPAQGILQFTLRWAAHGVSGWSLTTRGFILPARRAYLCCRR